ncbi:MAG: ApaLI family restriction endonuclease [Chloroflexi bacterium]|nr:ApaLI family restriction endonuclease [Chloroflexota bacterium]MBI5290505.1 ApaLI family restriction endonuclease [Chloroflexota bacterium]
MAVKDKIRELAERCSHELKERMSARVNEMESDDKSHYLIYRVLGITDKEGKLIDVYQNKGRFLYKYAGAFLEEATLLCFKERFPGAQKLQVKNTLGRRPKQFEIDCLVDKDALEIKWRDATTDGDHITKEHTRIQAIKEHGYKPIRVMFYYPNREQAIRIQATLRTIYDGVGGEYYGGDEAWDYVRQRTRIDLKRILSEIAEARASGRKR